MKICPTILFLMIVIALTVSDSLAFDEEITHPHLTRYAIAASRLQIYLSTKLGIQEGINKTVTYSGNNQNGINVSMKKKIYEWLMSGSTDEDIPTCRASNHFHNPLLPWSQSFMSDDTTSLAAKIRTFCSDTGWPYDQRTSNIVWASGLLEDGSLAHVAENTSTDPPSPNTWNKAREYFYKALTKDVEAVRDTYLARAFESIGQVMHLLEDMAVPAHVRNDFQSHLVFTGINSINPTKWYHNLFEYYVSNKDSELVTSMTASAPDSSITNKLTDLWDMEMYTGINPSGSLQQGLAEYTNANFVSDYTFTFGREDGSGQTTTVSGSHSFPYPTAASAERINKTITIHSSYGTGTRIRQYYRKVRDGDTGYLLAGVSYLQFVVESVSPVNSSETLRLLEIIPPMDDLVHKGYANRLLPRAVGYSAALLDYFFRGSIEISLPASGVYSSATGSDAGFTRITLVAKNTTTGEDMSDGTIQLVVKYKLAKEDPFGELPVETDEEFSYKVASGPVDVRAIQRDATKLTFDFSSDPIPFWATSVYLQLVYHGKLGNEEGALAVGFKDISEPTPVDLYNNMDRICLNGTWYAAGSPEALDHAPVGWDIYPHNIKDGYLKIAPPSDVTNASPSNCTFSDGMVAPRTLYRAYVLSDYDYPFNYSEYSPVVAIATTDTADHSGAILSRSKVGAAVKNQVDYQVTDQAACQEIGETAPCDILTYPLFYSFRGLTMWGPVGFIIENPKYPADTQCSWEALN